MGGSTSVEGYRVVHRLPGSPLEQADLQPYTDFIVSANGIRLSGDSTFSTITAKSVNCRVFLKVFSTLTQDMREAVVVPKEEWGGVGLLGGAVRFEEWTPDAEFGIRVVGVLPGSVAEAAGLTPGTDFIVGTDEVSITDIDQLAAQTLKRESLSLDVFSTVSKSVRRVSINFPTESRSLGLDLGQGFVHSIEKQLEVPPQPVVPVEKPQAPREKRKEEAVVPVQEPKVTYLKPAEEEKVVPPPPKPVPVEAETAPIPRVYRILGPPNIYEKNAESSQSFIVNILKSPFVQPGES